MIYAKPLKPFIAVLGNAPTGLVGTITVQVENPDGTTAVAATTGGIVEVEPTVYIATVTAPAQRTPTPTDDGTDFAAVWKNGSTRIPEDLKIAMQHPAATEDPLEITWRPSLEELVALLRTRTKNNFGVELGAFTTATRPTDEQAEAMIDYATPHVASRVGSVTDLCQDSLTSRARDMAALYAAMLIELSYFPEQVRNNQSPYQEYKKLFDEGMESLTDEVARECGEGEGVGDTDTGGGAPSFNFDVSTKPLGREFPW
jgi:hypothetical protein